MEIIEGPIYKSLKLYLETSVYEDCQQLCWQLSSYKNKIAMLAALLCLQQKKRIPSEVTAEDMLSVLLQKDKKTTELKEFKSHDLSEELGRPLLVLTWNVIISLKMRDIEFEARWLLDSPEAFPPCYLHSRLLHLAKSHVKMLSELHQEASRSRLLQPSEVVMEVTPKVIQLLWLPPPDSHLNMPSQCLSRLAVGLTKAVEDHVCRSLPTSVQPVQFSRSIRDSMVQSILEKIKQTFPQTILRKKLECFAIDILRTITNVTSGAICELFQTQDVQSPDDEVEDDEELKETTSPHATEQDANVQNDYNEEVSHSTSPIPPAMSQIFERTAKVTTRVVKQLTSYKSILTRFRKFITSFFVKLFRWQ